MVDALYRLQDAYQIGLLDQNMAQRSVTDAISEFGSGKCGVISLWEGDGADYLINELQKNGIEDDIIVMEPLEEMGSYIGKEPAVFAITTSCENPGGVMKYFFEPMLDGGAVQKLWTYGVEGYHWANAEATEDAQTLGNLDNQLVTLPYEGVDATTYNYNLIDPLRALATLEGTDPGISQISDLAAISASIANQYYEASPNVKYNETYWYYFGEIQAAREEAVNKVMLEGVDPVTALDEYKYNVQYIMDQVLSEMNQL
jgi:putative aldouronate transport system substrate-binding protein